MGDPIELSGGTTSRDVRPMTAEPPINIESCVCEESIDTEPLPQSSPYSLECLIAQDPPLRSTLFEQNLPDQVEQVQLGSPITIDSLQCLGDTVQDLSELIDAVRADPQVFFQNLQDRLLPEVLDHGTHEIELLGAMNVGSYRGGMRVANATTADIRLRIEDGRLSGTMDFHSDLERVFGPFSVSVNRIRIVTGEDGRVRFLVTATAFEIELDMTEDITEMFFGRRMSSVEGPASHIIQQLQEGLARNPLENMIDIAASRLRVRLNIQDNDQPMPDDEASRISLRLDRLEVTPQLVLTDMSAGIEISERRGGGYRITIPETRLGHLRETPSSLCYGQPNPGINIADTRIQNVVLNFSPISNPAQLGDALFQAVNAENPLTALGQVMYLENGEGEIMTGRISVNDDIVLNPIEEDHAVRFTLTGDEFGNLRATLDASEMSLRRATVILGGEMLHGQTTSVAAQEGGLRDLWAELSWEDGAFLYDAEVIPSLASLALNQYSSEGDLLAGAALLGLSCRSIALTGEIVTDEDFEHQVTARGCGLDPSEGFWTNATGAPAPGTANFELNRMGMEATFSPDGLRMNRLLLPRYSLSVRSRIGGTPFAVSIRNRDEIHPLDSGLALIWNAAETNATTYNAYVNTQFTRIQLDRQEGSFGMTGQLTGTIGVIDLAEPPLDGFMPPVFRPIAGGIDLVLGGRTSQISGNSALISGRILLSDDRSGILTLRALSQAAEPLSGTSRAEIRADLSRLIERTPRTGIPYYDFDPAVEQTIRIPRFSVDTRIPSLNPILVTGRAQVTRRPDGRVDTTCNIQIPVVAQTIQLSEGIRLDVGGIGTDEARVEITGVDEQVRIRFRPFEAINIHTTPELYGITYDITGTLTPRDQISASLDLRRGTFHLVEPTAPYALSGDLTIPARNAAGEVVGSGTVEVRGGYRVTGRMQDGHARIRLTVPSPVISPRVTSEIRAGDLTLPANSEGSIQFEGVSVDLDIDFGAVLRDLRHLQWTQEEEGE